jgi:hypothetical protein
MSAAILFFHVFDEGVKVLARKNVAGVVGAEMPVVESVQDEPEKNKMSRIAGSNPHQGVRFPVIAMMYVPILNIIRILIVL